jgi:hypothetical protein
MLSDEELQSISPCPLLRVAGDKVSETWEEQRRRPGVAPVLLGNRTAAAVVLQEGQRAGGSVAAVLEQALKLDVEAWKAERIRAKPDLYDVSKVDGPWDGVDRRIGPFIPSHDHRGVPYPEVFFALVQVEAPWQVPAHLRNNGLGDLPSSVVQVALFKRWYERYGAVLCTIADSVIELQLESSPMLTMEEAHALAVELFIYCPDNIHQGIITMGNYAAALRDTRLWYFWWGLNGIEL